MSSTSGSPDAWLVVAVIIVAIGGFLGGCELWMGWIARGRRPAPMTLEQAQCAINYHESLLTDTMIRKGEEKMAREIRPVEDRVWVRLITEESMSDGGIILPGGATGKGVLGKVEAVGAGKRTADGKLVKCECRAGDIVVMAGWTKEGIPSVTVGGVEYRVVRESDLLGIVR